MNARYGAVMWGEILAALDALDAGEVNPARRRVDATHHLDGEG